MGNTAEARIIRDGFQFALSQLPAAGQPQLKVYDTASGTAAEQLAAARADGATFVVGPLLKNDVAALAAAGSPPVPMLALNALANDARGPDKVRWITEDLGFDAAFDYNRRSADPDLPAITEPAPSVTWAVPPGERAAHAVARFQAPARFRRAGRTPAEPREQRPPAFVHRIGVGGVAVVEVFNEGGVRPVEERGVEKRGVGSHAGSFRSGVRRLELHDRAGLRDALRRRWAPRPAPRVR